MGSVFCMGSLWLYVYLGHKNCAGIIVASTRKCSTCICVWLWQKTLTVLLQIEKNSFLSIWDNLWQDLYLLSIMIHFSCLMLGFFTNHCANSYFQQKDLNKNCKIDSVPTEKKVLVSPEITLPLVQLNYNCHFFFCFYLRFWRRYYFRLCWWLLLGEEP